MKKISHKIWIGIMSVVLLLCFLILGFQMFLLEDLYLKRLTESITGDVLQIAEGFDEEQAEELYFRMDGLAYRRNLSMELVNKDGKTIYVTGENTGTQYESMDVMSDYEVTFMKNLGDNREVIQPLQGEDGLGITKETDGNTVEALQGAPIEDSGAGAGQGEELQGEDKGQKEPAESSQNEDAHQGDVEGQGEGALEGSVEENRQQDKEIPEDIPVTDEETEGDKPESTQEPLINEENFDEFQFIPEGEIRETMMEDVDDGDPTIVETLHPKYGFRLLIFSVPFTSMQNNSYKAMVALPLAEIDNIVDLISLVIFLSILFILFVAGVASSAVAVTVSRPLRNLSEAAEAIGAGDLDTRVVMKSRDEVGNVGRTFNVMAEKLEKAEKMKKEFVENVSHELRTPISVIRGYAEIIRDVTGDNKEKREKQLEVISSEADRLGFMVNDILDYSRMTSEGVLPEFTEFDFAELLQKLVNKYQLLVKESNIRIEYDLPGPLQGRADYGLMQQAVENLLRNAINYSPEGGTVKIMAMKNEGVIQIEISDQGMGIPENELPMIWERYYRTKGIKKRKILGSGLGLSIVKSIFEAHHATYGVRSRQGEGTVFWFQINDNR
ncbi:ATP-binding protein [Proteiniclasticum sp. C24MP]|uniref:ATP-binding protein n=1 Tax=Proteiniclasticum sp. C24MP TaxID=3374101 RepID=UPI0037549D29